MRPALLTAALLTLAPATALAGPDDFQLRSVSLGVGGTAGLAAGAVAYQGPGFGLGVDGLSPAVAGHLELGTAAARLDFGVFSVPLLVAARSGWEPLASYGTLTAGAVFGKPRVRFGPYAAVGLDDWGVGLRLAAHVFTAPGPRRHGFDVHLLTSPGPEAWNVQASVLYTFDFKEQPQGKKGGQKKGGQKKGGGGEG